MLQQMWAKLNARERFFLYGLGAVVVGWILGLILGNASNCVSAFGQTACYGSVNYFTLGNAGLLGMLALVAAIVGAVALYLRVAPNVNFTWPMPYAQAILGIAAIALICAVLMVLIQFTNPGDKPVLMLVADVVVVAGAALMAWGAYQEWTLNKTTPPAA